MRLQQKHLNKLLPLAILALLPIWYSCQKEEVLSPRDFFIADLEGTWIVNESGGASFNADDVTHLLLGLEITINKDLTFVTNSDQYKVEKFYWPTSGMFTLSDDFTQFIRDDGLPIRLLLDPLNNRLLFGFEVVPNAGGRVSEQPDSWGIVFKRK